jgi:hypothetical protein
MQGLNKVEMEPAVVLVVRHSETPSMRLPWSEVDDVCVFHEEQQGDKVELSFMKKAHTLSEDGSACLDVAPNAVAPSKQRRVAATRERSSGGLGMGKRSSGGSNLYGVRVGFRWCGRRSSVSILEVSTWRASLGGVGHGRPKSDVGARFCFEQAATPPRERLLPRVWTGHQQLVLVG